MKKHILSAVFTTLISTAALAESSAVIAFNELDANKDDGLSAAEAGALPDISAQWSTLGCRCRWKTEPRRVCCLSDARTCGRQGVTSHIALLSVVQG